MRASIELHDERRSDGTRLVRLVLNRRGRFRMSLGFSVNPEHFTPQKRIKGGRDGDPMHREKNLRIERALNEAMKVALENPLFSAKQVGARLMNSGGSDDFYSLARARLKMLQGNMEPNTVRNYASCLSIVEKVRPRLTMSHITPSLIEELKAVLSPGRNPNSVRIILKGLRVMWRAVCQWQSIEVPDPWARVKFRTVPSLKRGLLPDQFVRFATVDLSEEPKLILYRDAIVLSYYLAGMRWGDLCLLCDTDFEDGRLLRRQGKSGKITRWKVRPEAQAIMDRYQGEKTPRGRLVLPLVKSKDLLRDEDAAIAIACAKANRYLRRVCELAGVPRITTHGARHSTGVAAILQGIDLESMRQMYGHSSIAVTGGYVRSLEGMLNDDTSDRLYGPVRGRERDV